MRLVRVDQTVPQGGVIRLHHLTDLHAGAPDFAEAEFRDRVAMIADDDNARWTMGGDGGDLIRFNDRRYQPSELAQRYRQATDVRLATLEHLIELFQPIADKCVGWADGNHERKLDEHYGGHFGVEVCCALGLERLYVGYRGFIDMKFTVGTRKAHVPVLIDLQHGWQAGRSKGAAINQAEKELGVTDAAIVLRGHSHAPIVHTFATLGITRPARRGRARIVKRPRVFLNGGTWRHGIRDLPPPDRERLSDTEKDMWAETNGFRAEPVGGAVIVLHFDQGHGMHNELEGRSCGYDVGVVAGDITRERLGL